MLTAQFEGFTVTTDSADEMTAFVRSCSSLTQITSEAKIRRQPESVKALVEDAVKAAEVPQERAEGNERTVFVKRATDCGHTYEVNSPRGAKAALCPSCKGISSGNNSAPEAKPESVKPQTSGKKSGGKRNFKKNSDYTPKPLDEMPDDIQASDGQLDRIRVQANAKLAKGEVKKMEKRITSAPNPNPHGLGRISVREASAIYRELKAL